jgi:hypothetical protein
MLLHSAVLVVEGSDSAEVRGFAANNKFVFTRSLHTVNVVKQQGSYLAHTICLTKFERARVVIEVSVKDEYHS